MAPEEIGEGGFIQAPGTPTARFSKFDSLHVASAELSSASVFVTVDYPLLSRLRRNESVLRVRYSDPVRLVKEVFGGTVDYQSQ